MQWLRLELRVFEGRRRVALFALGVPAQSAIGP
jgi:hypothetical protein